MKLQKTKPFFRSAVKSKVLEMFIYAEIGENWLNPYVTPTDIASALRSAGTYDSITLRINSPGGSVFDGSAIYSLLKSQGKPVHVVIDGCAASAAFTIAMAGDTIEINEAAFMMLHDAWGGTVGESKDLRHMADLLDKMSDTMKSLYANRSGQSEDAVGAMMKATTWMNAKEALAAGFATQITAGSSQDAGAARALASQMLARSGTVQKANIPDILKADAINQAGPNAETGCPCACPECVAGNCGDCTMEDCDFDECDHGMVDETAMKASQDANQSSRARKLRLAEKAVHLDTH